LSGTVLNARPAKPTIVHPADIPAAVWAILTDKQKAQLAKASALTASTAP